MVVKLAIGSSDEGLAVRIMKQELADVDFPPFLIVQSSLVVLLDVAVFIDVQGFHQRAKRSDGEVHDFGLAKVVVVHTFLDLHVLKEEIFLADLFDLLLLLVDGTYFALQHVFPRLLIADFLHVGQLFRRNFFFDLSPCLELVHDFEHVVLQAQSSVSLALEVDLDDPAVVVDVDPSDVTFLNIYLVV